MARGDGPSRNLAIDLARELASILLEEKGITVTSPTALSLVAQTFQNHLSRDSLIVAAEDFFEAAHKRLEESSDQSLSDLASLPFTLFVTSRHDSALEHHLALKGKRPQVTAYEFKGDRTPTLGNLGSIEEPVVYRLYGAFDDPNSLVLTENDLLDFVTRGRRRRARLTRDLQNLFSEQNFLFLGFGVVDYHFRILLHVLNLSKSAKSFALERSPTPDDQSNFDLKFNESVLFYNELGYTALKLLDTELNHFIQELHQRWSQRNVGVEAKIELAPGNTPAPELADGPSVFISYVQENKPFAEELCSRLKQEGLNPWIDTDGLRSGARWDAALEDAITKEVDYFIVLQSAALSDRMESYVHKEVKLALERQDLRAGSFIFPVRIDEDAELLDALIRAKIQTGNLFDLDQSAAQLAKEIKREEQRRRRGR